MICFSFHPCGGEIPWRREWLPTAVFMPGEFHGQKSLEGYSPWGRKSQTRPRDFHFHVESRAFTSNYQVACKGFPGGSDGEESSCNAGDPGLIPGLERSPGEGNGNPLQDSNPENSVDRGAWRAIVHSVTESWTFSRLP